MSSLKDYMTDRSIEIKELWFRLDDSNPAAEIRIQFNYLYSKNFMYDQQCGEWISQLIEDVNDYQNIQRFLD